MKKIMVDMSATIIHHGHIRLLKKAKEYGDVVVALTTDDGVKEAKGYYPELEFNSRREILESIKYVDKVVPCSWLITDDFLDEHNIDYLIHGSDNVNPIDQSRLIIYDRTPGISASIIRGRVLKAVSDIYLGKESVEH